MTFVDCDACDGEGVVNVKIHGSQGPGLGYMDAEATCNECDGKGKFELMRVNVDIEVSSLIESDREFLVKELEKFSHHLNTVFPETKVKLSYRTTVREDGKEV